MSTLVCLSLCCNSTADKGVGHDVVLVLAAGATTAGDSHRQAVPEEAYRTPPADDPAGADVCNSGNRQP